MTTAKQVATDIANKWGPALTKAIITGADLDDFQSLFVSDQPIVVVLQNAEGTESEFTIGDGEDATMTWMDFHELTMADAKKQDFAKVECQCLGVLGDRMIMESGRFNAAGEVYLESYSLLTVNNEGKITAFEAFTDPQMSGLITAVENK